VTLVTDIHSIVRVRKFPISKREISLIERLFEAISIERATGKMTIHFSQGAINGEIIFEECAVIKH
jgi:hypothetical protein